MKRNNRISGLILGFIIVAIFFFMGRTLLANWQKIRGYQFSLNYAYLVISLIFPAITVVFFSLIWNRILRILEHQNTISNFKALKIFIYSWLGRYVPGKILQPVGQVYLGSREGLPVKTLTISVVFENVLFIISSFLVSLISLSVTFGSGFQKSYFIIGAIAVVGGLIAIQPKILYPCLNFFLRKIKKTEIDSSLSLNYKEIIEIIFYNTIVLILNGIGFFLLINSIIHLSWLNIAGVIGIYSLAGILGTLAFVPSGLGVREGILAGFLQLYFPAGVAVLISLIARIWATIPDLILLALIASMRSRKNMVRK